jgi:DNA uptake protein ComE-like DNA-binding protein
VARSPHRSRRPLFAAIAFALVPIVTLGFGSAPTFVLAALFVRGGRRASMALDVSAVVYVAATVVYLTTFDTQDSLPPVAAAALAIMLVGGGVEAIAFAPWIARHVRALDPDASRPMRSAAARRHVGDLIGDMEVSERESIAHDPAVRTAIRQRERRRVAREIAAEDPDLAANLRIGRPDLRRTFDDGGLIDVNHVKERVFRTLPGIDAAAADRIVRARERFDGLRSPADLVVHADLPNEVVEALGDRLMFVTDEP